MNANTKMTGTDLQDDGVAIILRGKEYHLSLDLAAICGLEKKFGTIQKAFEVLQNLDASKPGMMENLEFMLWKMLQHENWEMTEAEASHLIDYKDLQRIMSAINNVFESSFSDDGDEKNVKKPQETKNSRG